MTVRTPSCVRFGEPRQVGLPTPAGVVPAVRCPAHEGSYRPLTPGADRAGPRYRPVGGPATGVGSRGSSPAARYASSIRPIVGTASAALVSTGAPAVTAAWKARSWQV